MKLIEADKFRFGFLETELAHLVAILINISFYGIEVRINNVCDKYFRDRSNSPHSWKMNVLGVINNSLFLLLVALLGTMII